MKSTWWLYCECGALLREGYGCTYPAPRYVSFPCYRKKWYNFWKHRRTRLEGK